MIKTVLPRNCKVILRPPTFLFLRQRNAGKKPSKYGVAPGRIVLCVLATWSTVNNCMLRY